MEKEELRVNLMLNGKDELPIMRNSKRAEL